MPKDNKTHPRRKTLYRVKNWSEYDQASMSHDSITFWLLNDFEKNWQSRIATMLAMHCPLSRQAGYPNLPLEAESAPTP
jgi:hypothetical protein